MTTRVAIETLGCKLNQAESEALAVQFASAGCLVVKAGEAADVYVLNTCTVTHIADSKSRHLLRMARRANPRAMVVATGCYTVPAGAGPGEVEGVDLVVANPEKKRIVEIVSRRLGLERTSPGFDANPRTRAFIKVQDGCNHRCAYCIVPLVRGPEKSVDADKVIAEIKALTDSGCNEVVLTGTEIGSYRSAGVDFAALLKRVLDETAAPRLRISSLQPHELTPQLLALWEDTRLCPHFHISLQSGSDNVLSKMKRGYSIFDYSSAMSAVRKVLPGAAVTTDVIVGFPGETEADFDKTLEYCRSAGFARIHVFPFSARPGTGAAAMPGQVNAKVKKERGARLAAVGEKTAFDFRAGKIGTTADVLWEHTSRAGEYTGYTPDYIRIYTRSGRDLTNKLTRTALIKPYREGAWGEITGLEGKQ
jgi:threonylcarbamoyladenosine tRNA methylthiotransferase MtaB